jgi:hypothetical protein
MSNMQPTVNLAHLSHYLFTTNKKVAIRLYKMDILDFSNPILSWLPSSRLFEPKYLIPPTDPTI